MIDHIIWDWNGTLLDDVSFGYRLANWLLSQYHLPQIENLETYRRIFTFPVKDYYNAIGFGDDIFPEVAVKWMDKYMAEEHECPLQPGALEVTRLFREKGLRQVIISASQLENLKFQLKERPFFDYFEPPRGRGDIYAGSITNWAEVGGKNRIINPVTRLAGSGSQSAMDKFMGDTPIGRKSPLAITGGSIGFSFRYYLDGMVGSDNVKMLSLNGVYPSPENIQNGSYPVIARFYAIYRADNENENIQTLIDWLLSDEGQKIIEQCGYVRIG